MKSYLMMANEVPDRDDADRLPSPGRPNFTFYDRSVRSSLYWLAATLFFGGLPLTVYFTSPDPKVANAILGIALGIPLLATALWTLGKARALLVYADRRKIHYLESLYNYRKHEVFDFDDVLHIEARDTRVSSKGGGGGAWFEIHVVLKNGRLLVLGRPHALSALCGAQRLATAFGVPLAPGSRAVLGPFRKDPPHPE